MLTFTIALAMWAFLRALDETNRGRDLWAAAGRQPGRGLLLKSLMGVVFPVARRADLSGVTHQLFSRETWRRLHPFSGSADRAGDCPRRGMFWRRCAIRRISRSRLHSGPGRVSRLPVVLLYQRTGAAFPEPALSARLQHRAARCCSGRFTCSGSFPGACTFRRWRSYRIGRWIAPAARGCWRCAGRVSCWCSSPSPPRRNITRCRAIRRWRCCWARRWRWAGAGWGGERAFWACYARHAGRRAIGILIAVRNLPAIGDISQAVSKQSNYTALARPHAGPDPAVVRLYAPAADAGGGGVHRWCDRYAAPGIGRARFSPLW